MSNHDDPRNAFERNSPQEDPPETDFRADALPPLLARLLAKGEFLRGLKQTDLREMAKFDEVVNIEGLAAHRIERPEPDRAGGTDFEAQAIAGEPELPGGVSSPAARAICAKPIVVIEGTLAGAGPAPFSVRLLFPMTHAHLAAAFGRMLWPWPGGAGQPPVKYTLLFFPGAVARRDGPALLESFIGHWPEQGAGLTVGFDDPALAARLLLDAAGRVWRAEGGKGQYVEVGKMLVTVDGGQACLERIDDPAAVPPAARPALAEPLYVEKDDPGAIIALSPVWRDPLLPVAALGLDGGWSDAARSVGALPFGDVVDGKGHVALEQVATDPASREECLRNLDRGLVVVPRESIHAPWMRETCRYGVAGD